MGGRRNRVILATKQSGDHSPEFIRAAIENSLRNLRTDDIDLYMIHHSKPDRPIKD